MTGTTISNSRVAIQAGSGSISGAGLVTANDLSLQANKGISASTSVANLTANNHGSGDISISESDGLTIHGEGIGVSGDGNVSVILADGDLMADSPIVAEGSGGITLVNSGQVGDAISIDASISSNSGSIALSSSGNIEINGNISTFPIP